MDYAEDSGLGLTAQFPSHPFAWKALGSSLVETGRKEKAVDKNQTVVVLAHQDADAHSNLDNTLNEVGRFERLKSAMQKQLLCSPIPQTCTSTLAPY